MDERMKFIEEWRQRGESLALLCERYGISRKTGHKWVERYHQGGIANLIDRSRAPVRRPATMSEAVALSIVALREQHPTWGPRKLRAYLSNKQPQTAWPAPSTIGELLKARHLVPERRRRLRRPVRTQPLAHASAPNVVWAADFKGCFRVAGRWCHPLTVSDAFSRYVLVIEAMDGERTEPVQAAFETAFREYGLPWRMRTDNGPPFASTSVGGLSRLSTWWIKLGITPERIDPGRPQQNGRHERMHRTLGDETARPPASDVTAQQRTFARWRGEFNEERPHEALGNVPPATLYTRSTRAMPAELVDPDYPDDMLVRRVDKRGSVNIGGGSVFVSEILANEAIGMEAVGEDDGAWQLWFGPVYLGRVTQLGKARVQFAPNRGDCT